MKVLLVTHVYPEKAGGIETAAAALADRLARLGADVCWAACGKAPLSSHSRLQLLPLHAWPILEYCLGITFPIPAPRQVARLWRAVKKVDVVHVNDCIYLTSMFAFAFAKIMGKPTVVTQHAGPIQRQSRSISLSQISRHILHLLYCFLSCAMLQRAGQCVFISSHVLNYFRQFGGFAAAPVYIPNGINKNIFHPVGNAQRARLRAQLSWPTENFVVLFVGRFIRRKGLHVLRDLAQQFPECSWALVGCGPVDPRCWGLPNVIHVGRVEHFDIARYYHAADLLILPSQMEGLPLVAQEAMACGVPLLLSEFAALGLNEISAPIYTSGLAKKEFSHAFHRIVSDRESLLRRRSVVADFARQHWDWDVTAAEYMGVYRRVSRSPMAS